MPLTIYCLSSLLLPVTCTVYALGSNALSQSVTAVWVTMFPKSHIHSRTWSTKSSSLFLKHQESYNRVRHSMSKKEGRFKNVSLTSCKNNLCAVWPHDIQTLEDKHTTTPNYSLIRIIVIIVTFQTMLDSLFFVLYIMWVSTVRGYKYRGSQL